MKKYLFHRLQRFLFRFGITTQFYPSKEKIYTHLKNKNPLIQEYELRKISNVLKAINDHSYYNKFLKYFVPSFEDEKVQGIKIFGGGRGEGNLHSYRKVKINGKFYFEKIYFNSKNQLQTCLWFDNYIRPDLSNKIITPGIYKIVQGKLITIIYFEYLLLKPLRKQLINEKGIELITSLYLSYFNLDLNENAPLFLKDFRYNKSYCQRRSSFSKRLKSRSIDFDYLEEIISKSEVMISHGDLYPSNFFQNNKIIDWDSSGFRPIGYDLAYLYFSLFIIDKNFRYSPLEYMNLFIEKIQTNNKDNLKLNFYFFLYLFFIWRFNQNKHLEIEKLLIQKLKELQS